MALNKCPLCGKNTDDNESFCRDCQDIAKHSDSVESSNEDVVVDVETEESVIDDNNCSSEQLEQSELTNEDKIVVPEVEEQSIPTEEPAVTEELVDESTEEELVVMESVEEESAEDELVTESTEELELVPEESEIEDDEDIDEPIKKKSKTNTVIVTTLIVLCLVVGSIGSYIYLEKKNSTDAEKAYWEVCATDNTTLSYSKYLAQYPQGKFKEEAQQKIVEFKEKEEKQQEWESLKKSNDIKAYSAFIEKYPDTPYLDEINLIVDSLNWLSALRTNTQEAYKNYINGAKSDNSPRKFEALAQQKYDDLNSQKTVEVVNQKTVEVVDTKAIEKILTNFYKYLSAKQYKKAQELMAPSFTSYHGMKNIKKDAVIRSIETNIKNRKIKAVKYSPVIKSIKTVSKSKGAYLVTVPVVSEITYTDRKKKKETQQVTVNIGLNSKMQIEALYQKK